MAIRLKIWLLVHKINFQSCYFSKLISCCLVTGLVSSCQQVQKISDVFINPTPREQYARNFENRIDYKKWHTSFQAALKDSLRINLPYVVVGQFQADDFPVYSYTATFRRIDRFFGFITYQNIHQFGL